MDNLQKIIIQILNETNLFNKKFTSVKKPLKPHCTRPISELLLNTHTVYGLLLFSNGYTFREKDTQNTTLHERQTLYSNLKATRTNIKQTSHKKKIKERLSFTSKINNTVCTPKKSIDSRQDLLPVSRFSRQVVIRLLDITR